MRDIRRVITGEENYGGFANMRRCFEAAHIFPLALRQSSSSIGFANVAIMCEDESQTGINSPRNVLLLQTDVHELWDDHLIAVELNKSVEFCGRKPMTFRTGSYGSRFAAIQNIRPLVKFASTLQDRISQSIHTWNRRNGSISLAHRQKSV
ncbi:hypothetical protein VTN77DRAFT_5531 [Rasamsonia byssochlamydoides]|uniref:uncharacterized protein n=1 Tax=Rasamsonia byssochlamydoides TaxID=89139 RepID=UPI003743BC5B